MTVLRHKATGLLVTFRGERAGSLSGSDWAQVEVEKPKPVTRRRTRKTITDD